MNRIPLSILLLPALAFAAETPITGPVLGYAPIDGSVRPVYGIPGAAVLGPAADLGGTVKLAAAANDAGLLIAVLDDGRVMRYRGDAAITLEDAIFAPTRIALSPRGRAALLYSDESQTIQIITGLGGTVRIADPVAVEWRATALAISDAGRAVIAADGALWSAMPGRAPVHLMPVPDVSAIAFFAASNNMVFADAGALWVQRSGELQRVAEFNGAIALQTSGRALFAATAIGVSRIDLETGARADVSCSCNITDLEPMRGGAVFRLNRGGKEPIYLYDGQGAEQRILFVPAAAPESQGGAL